MCWSVYLVLYDEEDVEAARHGVLSRGMISSRPYLPEEVSCNKIIKDKHPQRPIQDGQLVISFSLFSTSVLPVIILLLRVLVLYLRSTEYE